MLDYKQKTDSERKANTRLHLKKHTLIGSMYIIWTKMKEFSVGQTDLQILIFFSFFSLEH